LWLLEGVAELTMSFCWLHDYKFNSIPFIEANTLYHRIQVNASSRIFSVNRYAYDIVKITESSDIYL
jgi:hypothetical protein